MVFQDLGGHSLGQSLGGRKALELFSALTFEKGTVGEGSLRFGSSALDPFFRTSAAALKHKAHNRVVSRGCGATTEA